jgi:hypothetical protein
MVSEKQLETCTALTITKSIIQRCVLLVMLKNSGNNFDDIKTNRGDRIL